MPNQSLAIKYRPSSWSEVVEQSSTLTILESQIKTNSIKHCYLFTGPAGCGKTSLGRIFAREINEGVGTPVELDAASNNSVDDVRVIIQQSRTAPLDGSKYRTYIIDECMTGDTEILTDKGFKRFDECDHTERVAEYTDDGEIIFVEPTEWITNPYSGELYKWSPRNWCSVRMTPNHVQPLYYSRSGVIKEQYIRDVRFHQRNNLIVAGKGRGTKSSLTPIDRLVIASQADGTIQFISKDGQYVHWSIQLIKSRKIERFKAICNEGNIPYSEIKGRCGASRFTYNLPITSSKLLSTHFELASFTYEGARDFIYEIVQWDGYTTDGYLEYLSTVKENCDFVSAVGTLGGYSARQRLQVDNRKASYKDCHKVFLYDTLYTSCASIGKTKNTEYYEGTVYCVKVPSHKIIVRAGGFVFITGNCHMLSNSAWNAMLKLLEEPPATSIFIFATTDPQKIPKTILSRVQRYDFQRISQQGIVHRLDYVLAKEVAEGNLPTGDHQDLDAIEYIAKLSDGGMRDALTMLDKCLAYSQDLTLKNVVAALGSANYEEMLHLTDALVSGDSKQMIEQIEQMHSQGKDLKLFIRSYTTFVLDLCKYDVTGTLEFTQLPNYYSDTLSAKAGNYYKICQNLLKLLLRLNTDIKWDTNPKAMIEANLYQFCIGE